MRKSRFTEEQIIGDPAGAGGGRPTADVCRKHGISGGTFYKWKSKFGGMDVSDAKRLKALEDENAKLKKLLAETMLDNAILKDVNSPKVVTPAARTAGRGSCVRSARRERAAGVPDHSGVDRSTMRYRSRRQMTPASGSAFGSWPHARRRFGYRRLHFLAHARKGCHMNQKRFRRLYREEGLAVRKRSGRKRALGVRAPTRAALASQRALVARLRLRLSHRRPALPHSGDRRRLHARMPGAGRGHVAVGMRVARELDAVIARRRPPENLRLRQRHRAHQHGDPELEQGQRRRLALHPARQAAAERVRRELHRAAARRMLERDAVLVARRSARAAGGMARRLQSGPAALRARQPHAGRVPRPPLALAVTNDQVQNFNPGLTL